MIAGLVEVVGFLVVVPGFTVVGFAEVVGLTVAEEVVGFTEVEVEGFVVAEDVVGFVVVEEVVGLLVVEEVVGFLVVEVVVGWVVALAFTVKLILVEQKLPAPFQVSTSA